jgi:hypothetical protein
LQVDIPTFLKRSLWKQNEGFLIPAYLTKRYLSPLDVSSAVYLTHEEVFGEKYTQEDLERDLSQLSVGDCLFLTSKILTILENEGRVDGPAQRSIAQELFADEIKGKILTILSKEPDRVVFAETQLLLVAQYALLYGKQETIYHFMDGASLSIYMKALLGISDLLEAGNHTEEDLQRAAIRSLYFFSKPNFFYSLRRTEDLFLHIPTELVTHHQYLDIPAIFHEATGLPLEDYLSMGTSLTALLMQQKVGQVKDDNWGITPETYFAESILAKAEIELLMKEFSIDVQTLHARYAPQNSFEFNFEGLVKHPLVRLDQNACFPLGFSFLKDKITVQVYWILFDHIKKTYGDKKLSRYTNFMGACFEEYIYRLLRRIYPSSAVLENRLVREPVSMLKKSLKKKIVDNIVINRSSLILIETKVSQLKVFATGIMGNLDAFREDVRKIVVEAFIQIQNTKEAFQKGLLRKDMPIEPTSINMFYPVVITYGKFIMFPLIWKIVEEEIQRVPDYDPELLSRLQVIQAHEIEAIEAFLETSGVTFEQLLQKKIADPVFKALPFHNYINHEFSQDKPLVSKYQEQQFDQFTDKFMLKVMGIQRPGKETKAL